MFDIRNIIIFTLFLEMTKALRTLIQTNGVLSLWKGLTPTLLRDVPFSAIYWVNYESLKSVYNQKAPTFAFSFMAGAIAGSVSYLLLNFNVPCHRRYLFFTTSYVQIFFNTDSCSHNFTF